MRKDRHSKQNAKNMNSKVEEEDFGHVLTLKLSTDFSQFLYRTTVFPCGLRNQFKSVDTGSCQSIIPNIDFEMIQSSITIRLTAVRIHVVTGHRLTPIMIAALVLLHPFRAHRRQSRFQKWASFVILVYISLQVAPNSTSVQSTIPGLITQYCNFKGRVLVDPAMLEAHGDPVF